MIDSSFVEAIQDNTKTAIVTVNGREYATRDVFNPPLPREPLTAALAISTLTGLVDYCKAFIAPGLDHVIQVKSYHEVLLLSKIQGEARQRENFVTANCGAPKFQFDRFMPHSEFMIAIQAQFVDYGDWVRVMKTVGTIRDEATKTSMDDGVTQKVTASAGIALAAEVSLPNPVMLKPYRTFTEVEQPPSQFVLRVQSGKNGLPDVALFEADGGRWKHEAISNVREYLAQHVNGITIIA